MRETHGFNFTLGEMEIARLNCANYCDALLYEANRNQSHNRKSHTRGIVIAVIGAMTGGFATNGTPPLIRAISAAVGAVIGYGIGAFYTFACHFNKQKKENMVKVAYGINAVVMETYTKRKI